MENITHRIRFIILDTEGEVLKNFLFNDREYNSREEACEAAQTVCCILTNYCGWDVFYRVVVSVNATGGTFHDDGEGHIVPDEDEEEYEDEEEDCAYNELTDKEISAILKQTCDILRKKYEDE